MEYSKKILEELFYTVLLNQTPVFITPDCKIEKFDWLKSINKENLYFVNTYTKKYKYPLTKRSIDMINVTKNPNNKEIIIVNSLIYTPFYYLCNNNSELLKLLKNKIPKIILHIKKEMFINNSEYLEELNFDNYEEIFQ